MVLANVPSFRFSFLGNIRRNHPFGNHPFVNTKKGHWEIKGRFLKGWFWRTYPRSGFRSGGTSAKTTLLETTLLGSPDSSQQWLRQCLPQVAAPFKLSCAILPLSLVHEALVMSYLSSSGHDVLAKWERHMAVPYCPGECEQQHCDRGAFFEGLQQHVLDHLGRDGVSTADLWALICFQAHSMQTCHEDRKSPRHSPTACREW